MESTGSAIDGLPDNPSSKDVMNKLKDQQVNVTDKLSSSILFLHGNQGTDGQWLVENLPENNVIMQCEVYLHNSLIARSASIRNRWFHGDFNRESYMVGNQPK